MAHRCSLTGKQAQFGHHVSHSNRKTNRRFLPNVQKVTLVSETLGRSLSLYVCTRALRTVQKHVKAERMDRAFQTLLETGMVTQRQEDTEGRKATIWSVRG